MIIDKSKIIVTIDRSQAERRYQLNIRNENGSFEKISGPLSPRDFFYTHGFSHEFPHETDRPGRH